jgi:hypothetical protein
MHRIAVERYPGLQSAMTVGPAQALEIGDGFIELRETDEGFVVVARSQRRFVPEGKTHGALPRELRFPIADPDDAVSRAGAVTAAIDWIRDPDATGEFSPGPTEVKGKP